MHTYTVTPKRTHAEQMNHMLEDALSSYYLLVCAVNVFHRFESRDYDEEINQAIASYFLRNGSETVGFVHFAQKDCDPVPNFEVVKDNRVIGQGAGVVAWCKFLQEHNLLAPWVEV